MNVFTRIRTRKIIYFNGARISFPNIPQNNLSADFISVESIIHYSYFTLCHSIFVCQMTSIIVPSSRVRMYTLDNNIFAGLRSTLVPGETRFLVSQTPLAPWMTLTNRTTSGDRHCTRNASPISELCTMSSWSHPIPLPPKKRPLPVYTYNT